MTHRISLARKSENLIRNKCAIPNSSLKQFLRTYLSFCLLSRLTPSFVRRQFEMLWFWCACNSWVLNSRARSGHGIGKPEFSVKKNRNSGENTKAKNTSFDWRACANFYSDLLKKKLFYCLSLFMYPLAIKRTKTSFARFPAKNIPNIEPDLLHWPIRMLKSEWRQWEWVLSTNLAFMCVRHICRQKVVRVNQYRAHLKFVFYFSFLSELTCNIKLKSYKSVFSIF